MGGAYPELVLVRFEGVLCGLLTAVEAAGLSTAELAGRDDGRTIELPGAVGSVKPSEGFSPLGALMSTRVMIDGPFVLEPNPTAEADRGAEETPLGEVVPEVEADRLMGFGLVELETAPGGLEVVVATAVPFAGDGVVEVGFDLRVLAVLERLTPEEDPAVVEVGAGTDEAATPLMVVLLLAFLLTPGLWSPTFSTFHSPSPSVVAAAAPFFPPAIRLTFVTATSPPRAGSSSEDEPSFPPPLLEINPPPPAFRRFRFVLVDQTPPPEALTIESGLPALRPPPRTLLLILPASLPSPLFEPPPPNRLLKEEKKPLFRLIDAVSLPLANEEATDEADDRLLDNDGFLPRPPTSDWVFRPVVPFRRVPSSESELEPAACWVVDRLLFQVEEGAWGGAEGPFRLPLAMTPRGEGWETERCRSVRLFSTTLSWVSSSELLPPLSITDSSPLDGGVRCWPACLRAIEAEGDRTESSSDE